MTTSFERLFLFGVSIIIVLCYVILSIHRPVDSPQIQFFHYRSAEKLEQVDAIQSFVRMVNQHPQSQERYGRQLGSAVFISDLATELQIGCPKLHEWIRSEVIESGHGSLDEGHWPTATEDQRASAIEYLGSRRLLIRF